MAYIDENGTVHNEDNCLSDISTPEPKTEEKLLEDLSLAIKNRERALTKWGNCLDRVEKLQTEKAEMINDFKGLKKYVIKNYGELTNLEKLIEELISKYKGE